MHVALIIDEARLHEEEGKLRRLAIGLMSEGLRITCLLPADAELERPIGLARTRSASMRVLPWARHDRTTRVASAFDRAVPDVIHAIGQDAWTLGTDLAAHLERPLAIDIMHAAEIDRVPRGRRAETVAAYIAPTVPMAEALRELVPPDLVCLVPAGVAIPAQGRPVLTGADRPGGSRPAGIAIIGSGQDLPMYRAMLGGLARILEVFPDLRVFLELRGKHEHEIWREARRLELLHAISTFAAAAEQRALVTECDMLLVPERQGELRSLMLEAMATGMPVVAADDPWLDMLIDGRTASVVTDPTPEAWGLAIESLLSDPEKARTLGRGGRERIGAKHRSTDQLRSLVTAYEQILTGDAIRIREEKPR